MTTAVMYSGGADSTLVLMEIINKHVDVIAIYVDFDCERTNPNRVQNLHHVLSFCEAYKINLRVETVKPENNGKGPEGNARQAFKRVRDAAVEQYDCVVLGHNKDDHIETVMIQLFRGAGKGAAGIPDYHKGRIYRPLLDMTREEIRTRCDDLGLDYFDDPSNEDTTMTRSFWRNEIIPKLKEHYGDGVYKRIDKISEKFR